MNMEEIKVMIKDCVYSEDGITYMSDKQYNNCINIIEQLQQENQSLKKENKILRENAEHNDKVVDKFIWENLKLKKQLEEYKLITIDYQELEARNQELEQVIDKAIEYIGSNDIEVLKYYDIPSETTSYEIVTVDLLKILRGDSDK